MIELQNRMLKFSHKLACLYKLKKEQIKELALNRHRQYVTTDLILGIEYRYIIEENKAQPLLFLYPATEPEMGRLPANSKAAHSDFVFKPAKTSTIIFPKESEQSTMLHRIKSVSPNISKP